jgi:proteic killer suppression protein
MEILFEDKELADSANWRGKFSHVSDRLKERIEALRTADNLAFVIKNYRGWRCHEYDGKGRGTYTLDLNGAWRLWFRPTKIPPPRKLDGGIDTSQVTSITILEVINPH